MGPCPIHSGRKPNFHFFPEEHDGHGNRCNFICYSRHCDQSFSGNIIGFVQAVLSSQKLGWQTDGDETVSWRDAINYICDVIKIDYEDIVYDDTLAEIQRSQKTLDLLCDEPHKKAGRVCSREQIRKVLDIPSTYYIDRGFPASLLDSHDIGFCSNPTKSMYNRVVIPVYDEDDRDSVIGMIGRIIYPHCESCGFYHPDDRDCVDPKKDNVLDFVRWKVNTDKYGKPKFFDKHHLYNYWFSKELIWQTRKIVVVEGVSEVLKLKMAGIENVVALFGSNPSDIQYTTIEKCGATRMFVGTDNDPAGDSCFHQLQKNCIFQSKITRIEFEGEQIGDLDPSYIKKVIKPQIDKG